MSLTYGQLGMIHEFGTTRAGRGNAVTIPARPFLAPAIENNRSSLSALNRDLLSKLLHGDLTKRAALGKLGGHGEYLVKEQIRNTYSPPNAPSTIARKGSDHPLIDSGAMMDNVQWEYEE